MNLLSTFTANYVLLDAWISSDTLRLHYVAEEVGGGFAAVLGSNAVQVNGHLLCKPFTYLLRSFS